MQVSTRRRSRGRSLSRSRSRKITDEIENGLPDESPEYNDDEVTDADEDMGLVKQPPRRTDAPESSEKSKGFGSLTWIIIATAVAFLIAGGVYFTWRHYRPKAIGFDRVTDELVFYAKAVGSQRGCEGLHSLDRVHAAMDRFPVDESIKNGLKGSANLYADVMETTRGAGCPVKLKHVSKVNQEMDNLVKTPAIKNTQEFKRLLVQYYGSAVALVTAHRDEDIMQENRALRNIMDDSRALDVFFKEIPKKFKINCDNIGNLDITNEDRHSLATLVKHHKLTNKASCHNSTSAIKGLECDSFDYGEAC